MYAFESARAHSCALVSGSRGERVSKVRGESAALVVFFSVALRNKKTVEVKNEVNPRSGEKLDKEEITLS